MKKFFIVALAVFGFVAGFLCTGKAAAYDVPSFLEVAGRNVKYKNPQQQEYGNMIYFYECHLNTDLNNDFASQYIQILTTRYNFRLVNHVHERNKKNMWDVDNYYFVYTGNKDVWWPGESYHLRFRRWRIYSTAPAFANTTQFEVELGHNLVYGGK